MDPIICPECGAPMVLRRTDKYKWKNGEGRKFYGCSRWPKCNAVHGAHPDGRPLGIPANKETKAARIRAHEALDAVCRARGWGDDARQAGRGAYIWLGRKLNISENDIREKCHIAMFDLAMCERVIAICTNALQRTTYERRLFP